MNITSIQNSNVSTNFGCNDPSCNNCKCSCTPQQLTQAVDTVEISTGAKVKNACKKGVNFIKNNKSGIFATGKALLEGVLASCTILGANQLMQKVSKSDTSSLASKLAFIGGLAVTGTQLIKDRNAFKKEVNNK